MRFEDIVGQVENLAKRIEREINEGRVREEDLASANAVLETLEGLHFTRVKSDAAKNTTNDDTVEVETKRERAA
jgi:hypothetical protein